MKRFLTLFLALLIGATPFALAHPGRTDSNGGHKDSKNKSGLGSYHYHCGGNPAHLHPGGVCPYSGSAKSTSGARASGSAQPADQTIDVQSIVMDMPAEIPAGQSIPLAASLSPADASGSTLEWSSSNPDVASISNGQLLTKAAGEATITATAKSGVTAACTVVVLPVPVGSVRITAPAGPVFAGDEIALSTSILPENATSKSILWASSDESVASVAPTGAFTAHAPGTVTITATADNGVEDTLEITVEEVLPTSIKIQGDILEYGETPLELDETVDLTVVITPDNASNTAYTLHVDDESVATLEGNTLIPHAGGTVTITATASNGLTDAVTVTIRQAFGGAPLGGAIVAAAAIGAGVYYKKKKAKSPPPAGN